MHTVLRSPIRDTLNRILFSKTNSILQHTVPRTKAESGSRNDGNANLR
jgi:hypothetical protein